MRNVANLVPPYKPNDDYHGTSAAIEFAVMGLKVKHIVVMGHAQCGGVKAYAELQHDPYMRPLAPGDFIGGWIKLLARRPKSSARRRSRCSNGRSGWRWESIKQSLANLRSFPYIATLESAAGCRCMAPISASAAGELTGAGQERRQFPPGRRGAYEALGKEPRF